MIYLTIYSIYFTIVLIKFSDRSAFIEACYDIFYNEIIEYDITNEEPALFEKKCNSNYRQNMLPINLDDYKFRTRKRCTLGPYVQRLRVVHKACFNKCAAILELYIVFHINKEYNSTHVF